METLDLSHEESGLEAQFPELSLPAVRTKIQGWLGAQRRYPPLDASSEYGTYIQECSPIPCGTPFRFQVKRTPVLAKVMSSDRRRQVQIAPKFQPLIKGAAIEIGEPDLLFYKSGSGTVADAPVRGIVNNRPFDYALTARKLIAPIQVAVICPAPEAQKLSDYLQRLNQSIQQGKYEADYLLPFQGFQSAFGTESSFRRPAAICGSRAPRSCPSGRRSRH
jgi:hypothetical protein